MQSPRLAHITSSILLAGLLFAKPSFAKQPPSEESPLANVTIEGILLRLQIHLWDYRATIPSFFCDERVVSDMDVSQLTLRRRTAMNTGFTTTDSVFHLKRSDPGVTPVQLTEAREVKAVNNKPAQGQAITGPAIFSGAFSSGPSIVSLEFKHCYDYHLVPGQRFRHHLAIVVDYALKPSLTPSDQCPGPEMQTGRAYIDPQTSQLLRVEMRTPNHRLDSNILSLWTWSVDYAPVTFNDKLFWMPSTISSAAISNDGATRWSFVATYRNYHKLSVTSRILPTGDN